jgi:hypothetical protein
MESAVAVIAAQPTRGIAGGMAEDGLLLAANLERKAGNHPAPGRLAFFVPAQSGPLRLWWRDLCSLSTAPLSGADSRYFRLNLLTAGKLKLAVRLKLFPSAPIVRCSLEAITKGFL